MYDSGNSAKKFEILLKVLSGELTLEPPFLYVTGHIFFRQTKVFGSFGVKCKHLWQWALVRFEKHPSPLLRPSYRTVMGSNNTIQYTYTMNMNVYLNKYKSC